MMKVGILTGGGDCPGLNAVIRAVVKRGRQLDMEFIGIKDGWKGLVEQMTFPIEARMISGILPRGGTILGTSRTNPFKNAEDSRIAIETAKKLGLACIVCIGGDDTLGVAAEMQKRGVNTVGVPKTIDNDLSATDFTFGFDTAVSIVTEALDRLHTTTEAHHRVMVVEVMGRHAGWIAVFGGLAGGADMILIPEKPFNIKDVVRAVKTRKEAGKNFSIIVVAEGAIPGGVGETITKDEERDAFGNVKLGGIGELLATELEQRTMSETRHVVLGHLQRGGSPTAHDRILATRYGVKAAELVHEGRFGRMVALAGNKIVDVSIEEAVGKTKTVDEEMYRIASVFFA